MSAINLLAAVTGPGTDWRDDALCAQVAPDMWFPPVGERAIEAKRICRQCPVRAQCLQAALDNNETDGIWAGTSPKERAAMKRRTAA